MLTVLFWIGGLVVVYVMITFCVHVYRIKTDAQYRAKLQLVELERHLQDRVQRLHGGADGVWR